MDSMTCDCLYIVKWLGFSDTTKEPAMNLKNSTRFIKKFYSRKETMEYLENNLVKVFRTPTCKCILQGKKKTLNSIVENCDLIHLFYFRHDPFAIRTVRSIN